MCELQESGLYCFQQPSGGGGPGTGPRGPKQASIDIPGGNLNDATA